MRQLLLPRQGFVAEAQAEKRERPGDETERVPEGIRADLQTNSEIFHRGLRRRPPRRQSREK